MASLADCAMFTSDPSGGLKASVKAVLKFKLFVPTNVGMHRYIPTLTPLESSRRTKRCDRRTLLGSWMFVFVLDGVGGMSKLPRPIAVVNSYSSKIGKPT